MLLLEYVAWSGVASCFSVVTYVAHVAGMWGYDEMISRIIVVFAWTILIAACFAVPSLAWAVALARHVGQVRSQLREFRMQDTLCSCCSKEHRDPDTGAVIPCDRELVYMKLKEWYGQAPDMDDEFLERFNSLIQKSLADSVLKRMSNLLPRRYSFYMIAAANLPWLSEYLAIILHRINWPLETQDNAIFHLRTFMQWGMMSMVLLLGSWVERFAAFHVGVRLTRYMPYFCAAILLFPICALPVIIFLGSFYILVLTYPATLFEAIPFSILLLLLLCYGGSHLVRGQSVPGPANVVEPQNLLEGSAEHKSTAKF